MRGGLVMVRVLVVTLLLVVGRVGADDALPDPKAPGDLVLEGDQWVNDPTWMVTYTYLHITPTFTAFPDTTPPARNWRDRWSNWSTRGAGYSIRLTPRYDGLPPIPVAAQHIPRLFWYDGGKPPRTRNRYRCADGKLVSGWDVIVWEQEGEPPRAWCFRDMPEAVVLPVKGTTATGDRAWR